MVDGRGKRVPLSTAGNFYSMIFSRSTLYTNILLSVLTMPIVCGAQSSVVCPKFAPSAQKITQEGTLPFGRRGIMSWTDSNGDWWIWGGRYIAPGNVHTSTDELWKYNKTTASGNPEWTKITPINAGPSANYNNVGWADDAGNLWLIDRLSTWKFDTNTLNWTLVVQGSDVSPYTAGFGEAPAVWKDKHGNFVSHSSWYVEIYRYTIGSNPTSPQWLTYEYDDRTLEGPLPRSWPAAFIHKNGEDLFLFGGRFGPGNVKYNDMWKYRPSDILAEKGTWTKLTPPTGTPWPTERISTSYWTDSVGDFWMYGGNNSTAGYLKELWRYSAGSNPDNPQWENLTPTNTGYAWPGNRYMATQWTSNDDGLYMFGGAASYGAAHSNEMWRFDSASSAMQFTTEVNSPVGIVVPVVDPDNNADLTVNVPPQHGTLTPILSGNRTVRFTYSPDNNFEGSDTFTLGFGNMPCVDPNQVRSINVRMTPRNTSAIREWGLYQ